ncbi:von Willebrand factor type A domain protein [Polystyrenella longa]|uniref:von Willebrand factor type A domain protein n=1 Tax=Polystyrenella longa TaxID=2528007 RepID=A0A518CNH7_9PLAN|nr:DUF58 domain-containing protein [Polystyrenella longa]QDU80777.1 von Willebrand factor type A domain protein [Polystyrenella longa]
MMSAQSSQPDSSAHLHQHRLLRDIHRLKIRCDSLIDQDFAGIYDSALKGSGIEFEETRPYQPGDDVRAMDWRVTARTGIPHIRQFREERHLTIHIVVDCSKSMQRTGRSSYVVAQEFSALITMLAVTEGDRVGLTMFSSEVNSTLPPEGGLSHAMRILHELIHAQSLDGETDIDSALQQVCRTQRRRSVLFLISDFLVTDLQRSLSIASAQHQIIPVYISDNADYELPPSGLLPTRDRETGEVRWIDAFSKAQRAAYYESEQIAQRRWDSLFQRLKSPPIKLNTESDVARELRKYFSRKDRAS